MLSASAQTISSAHAHDLPHMFYILILNICQSSSDDDYGDYDVDDDFDDVIMTIVVVLKIVVLVVTMMTLVKVRCNPDRDLER